MRFEVKLYSYHDMDLVALYITNQMNFPEATKQILTAYAKGELFRIRLNQEQVIKAAPNRRFFHYSVILDEKEDAAAIKMLRDITKGCRNHFVKTLLRQFTGCPIPYYYSASGNGQTFRSISQGFQSQLEEREIVGARKGSEKTGRSDPKPKKKETSKESQKSVDNAFPAPELRPVDTPKQTEEHNTQFTGNHPFSTPFVTAPQTGHDQKEEDDISGVLANIMEEY